MIPCDPHGGIKNRCSIFLKMRPSGVKHLLKVMDPASEDARFKLMSSSIIHFLCGDLS